MANDLNHLQINFSDESLQVLNWCLAFIMFGVALGIVPGDFKELRSRPLSALAGVGAQFVLLPAGTLLLVWLSAPQPAFALGMFLVAACPGGNISNFITALSKGNVALSIALTGAATLLTPLLTPLNFEWTASAWEASRNLLQGFSISFTEMLYTVLLLLVLPLCAGLALRKFKPQWARTLAKPVRFLSILILFAFIGVAILNNSGAFKQHFATIFLLVLVHNALALVLGYGTARLLRCPTEDCRTVSIETGIQNSGLGLVIIFTFFDGNAGMALVAAWWGVWHIVSGLLLSLYFSRRRAAVSAG